MNTSKIKIEPLDMERNVQPVPQKMRKKAKLPGQPRRPNSSFFIWMNANRDEIKTENAGESIKNIAKIGKAI